MKRGCIVFDMDGVLFDSEALVIQCWRTVAERYQIPDIETTCRRCLGANAVASKQIFLEVYGDAFPYDTYKAEMSACYQAHVKKGDLQMKPGVKLLLEILQEKEWKVGIASSTRTPVIQNQLRIFGLEHCFHQVIGGDMVQNSKPKPDIYLAACAALGVAPADAYAVEDSYNGVRSAHAAGMCVVMVPDLLPPTPEMQQLANYIFSNMAELQKHLFGVA